MPSDSGLPRAAAAKNIELNVSARDNNGDILHIVATGDKLSSLVGLIRVVCNIKGAPPIPEEEAIDIGVICGPSGETTANEELILNYGCHDGVITIYMDGDPPTLIITGTQGFSCEFVADGCASCKVNVTLKIK